MFFLGIFFVAGLFLFSSGRWSGARAAADTSGDSAAETAAGQDEELSEEEKKQEIERKKKELEEVEGRVDKYKDKTDKLSGEVEDLESLIQGISEEVAIAERSIDKVQAEINAIDQDITGKVQAINVQEVQLQERRAVLAEYVRIISRLSRQSMLEVMLSSDSVAEYFKELSWLSQTSADLKKVYMEIKQRKEQLMADKEILENTKQEQVALKLMQEQQRRYLEKKISLKNEVLDKTKGDESRFQALLDTEEQLADKLTEELEALQSLGRAIDFGDAVEAAKYASKKVGVRVPYLLGILRVESNMGTNVGGGTYKKDMHPAQRTIFEDICKELGYNPDKMPVSKKPCYRDSDGNCSGWGGAMGPAQFMPSTWEGYKEEVEDECNTKKADPWNLRHALVAMALKVAKVPGVIDGKRSAEHKAANIYLAGGNWDKFTWYGDRVMKFTDAFEEKIEEEGL
ncbi:MAG: hypothetical protein ABIC19_00420 [Patescibacteria group bacterium]